MASDVAEDASDASGNVAPSSSSEAADVPIRRNTGDLEEVMRRRREVCKEFESAPQGSTADAGGSSAAGTGTGAVEVGADEPTSSDGLQFEPPIRKAPAANAESSNEAPTSGKVGQTGGLHMYTGLNFVGGLADVKTSRPDKFARSGQKSVSELHSWMDQMRKRCEELESTPEPTVADVQASDHAGKASAATEHDNEAAGEDAEKRCSDPIRRHRKDPGELQDLLAQMRNRCEVLESTPEDTTADAKHEVAPEVQHHVSTRADPAPSKPSQGTADAAQDVLEPSPSGSTSLPGVEAVRAQLQGGAPLSDAERVEFWSAQLCSQLESAGEDTGDLAGDAAGDQHLLKSSAALSQLLNGQADKSGNDSVNVRLATAFAKKFVTWLSGRRRAVPVDDDDGSNTHMMAFIAQLWRYHFPGAACTVEAVASAARSAARAAQAQTGAPLPSGLDLVGALDAACGGSHGLAELLFMPEDEAEASALRLVCDFVVLEGEELLLVFIAVVCLARAVEELDTSSTLEQVQACLRRSFVLGAAAACEGGVAGCIADALSLLDRTPVTLLSALACGQGSVELPLPMCIIAPDEVLHHIYETPGRSWRLIIVDARMIPSKVALPISMRLGPTAHTHRRQVLKETPEEESIHLCLMGDGAPGPGDDAFELCRFLVGPNVKRRHISVVDGGWPAVAKLAYSLRLHLMPIEPETDEEPFSRSNEGFQLAKEQARAKVAEVIPKVAEQVAEATAAGQKVAKKMLANAGRAWQRLSAEPMFGKSVPTDSSSN